MADQNEYYAIIPANVRYSEKLTPNAKLLYGEITALCNEKGYCWAGNQYFANLYKVSKTTISVCVNFLVREGYISCDMQYIDGTRGIDKRYIKILNNPIKENLNTLLKKSLTPSMQKVNDPVKENFRDNNTMNTKACALAISNPKT